MREPGIYLSRPTSEISVMLVQLDMIELSSGFILLTVLGGASFAGPFCYLCFVCVCHTILSVPCSLLITCWEGADSGADVLALCVLCFLVFLSHFHMMSYVRCGV